jgi:hypothetical protein
MNKYGKNEDMNIAIVCDLGHASPRVIGLSDSLVDLGHKVSIFTPGMSKRQKRFLGVPSLPRWTLIETKSFPMLYRRFPGYPRLLRKILELLFNSYSRLKLKFYKIEPYTRTSSDVWNDEHQTWFGHVKPLFNRSHKNLPFDFIVSSSSPFSAHKIASELSRELGINWVADYRDLWSKNYIRDKSPTHNQELYEMDILKNCIGATTVSSETKFLLSEIYKGPIEIIYNGYLSKNDYKPKILGDELVILYVGGLYLQNQELDSFLDTVHQHNESHALLVRIRVQFLGDSAISVARLYKSQNKVIPQWVSLIKSVSREESYKLQSLADALLMLEWSDASQKGVLRTKMFEYLSSLKPILSYGGSYDESYVVQKDSGMSIFIQDSHELSEFFASLVPGQVFNLSPNLKYISQFSYLQQGKNLSNFIQKLREMG